MLGVYKQGPFLQLLTPDLTSVEIVRSGLAQAEACGLQPAHAQLN